MHCARTPGFVAAALLAAAALVSGCSIQTGSDARGLADEPTSAAVTETSSSTPCTPAAGADCTGVDLANADLAGLDLTGISLKDADLTGANLTGANLTDAVLTGAILTRADLTKATLTADSLDPVFADATLCMTKAAGGVIDSRSCPCTGGGAAGSEETTLGSLALGNLDYNTYDYAPVRGQKVALDKNEVLNYLWGTTWGGNGTSTIALPEITGPWAGVREGEDGTGRCLTWAVKAANGVFASGPIAGVLRGEIAMTSVQSRDFIDSQVGWGAKVDDTIGGLLGEGFTALALPLRWPFPDTIAPALGSLHLFPNSFEFHGFHPFLQKADGSPVRDDGDIYRTYMSDHVPDVKAPDGYTWYVAIRGDFPVKPGS